MNSSQNFQVLTLQASNMTPDDLTLTFRDHQTTPLSDVVQSSDPSGTHLWLQSRVPLGYVFFSWHFFCFDLVNPLDIINFCSRCVPSQSTTTIKLELLPLMDGIINLDSLQIDVMEKGIN